MGGGTSGAVLEAGPDHDAWAAAGLEGWGWRDPDAVERALEANTISYGHMVGTCPMGPVLDADCRVRGISNLRVADASVMPTIPAGNTHLGCVMVAERVAGKMRAEGCRSTSRDLRLAVGI